MELPYATIKTVHVTAVAATAALFALRAAWMMFAPARLAQRWVKIVPHAIDTLLLLSGIWLAWQIGAAGVRGWLAAKIVGLVLYIVLGTIALKRGPTRGIRVGAAIASLMTLAYIVSVALTKSPWVLLAR